MPIVAGAPLLLPPYTDFEGAFQAAVPVANPAPAANANYKTGGDFFEVLVTVYFVFATSGAAGNRQPALAISDADNRTIIVLGAIAVQPPGSTGTYTFGTNVATVSANGGLTQTVQAPILVLFQGWNVNFGATNPQAGDQVSQAYIISQRYPTGTPTSRRPAPVARTLV